MGVIRLLVETKLSETRFRFNGAVPLLNIEYSWTTDWWIKVNHYKGYFGFILLTPIGVNIPMSVHVKCVRGSFDTNEKSGETSTWFNIAELIPNKPEDVKGFALVE